MKKLMLILILLTVTLFYFGCNESPQSITSVTQTDKMSVPFKGNWQGITTVLGETERLITCNGNCTHLGLFNAEVHYWITYGDPGFPYYGTLTGGSATMVAANGDIVYLGGLTGTWAVNFELNPWMVEFTCNGNVVGGTGRFAGATGTLEGSGTQDLNNPQNAWYSWTGTIQY